MSASCLSLRRRASVASTTGRGVDGIRAGYPRGALSLRAVRRSAGRRPRWRNAQCRTRAVLQRPLQHVGLAVADSAHPERHRACRLSPDVGVLRNKMWTCSYFCIGQMRSNAMTRTAANLTSFWGSTVTVRRRRFSLRTNCIVALCEHGQAGVGRCRFPNSMSSSRFECHPDVINDTKVRTTFDVHMRSASRVARRSESTTGRWPMDGNAGAKARTSL